MKYYINVYYLYEDSTIIHNFTLMTASCKFLQNTKYNNLCKLQSQMRICYNFSCCMQHSSNEASFLPYNRLMLSQINAWVDYFGFWLSYLLPLIFRSPFLHTPNKCVLWTPSKIANFQSLACTKCNTNAI